MPQGKNIQEPQPKFIEAHLDYFREEREGWFTFLSKKHPETQQLVLNRTGAEVKDMCDGTKTLQEISKHFKVRYPKISSHTIMKDINNIVRSFWKLGLIEWIGPNPFSKMYVKRLGNNSEAYVATEEDVERITAFLESFGIPKRRQGIEDEEAFYTNPVLPSDGYGEAVIRQKIFFNTEGFFLLCDHDELSGLISLTLPNAWLPDRTTMIGLMLTTHMDTSAALFSELFDFAVATLHGVLPPQIQCTKIKCLHLQEEEGKTDSRLSDFLSAKSFKHETEFKDELGWGKDLQVFSRWLLT